MAEARMPQTKPNAPIATPEDYAATFQGFKPGSKVLEDLVARFHDRRTYCAGGIEGQRETERRAAQKDVITFILQRIGQLGEEHADS